jgi:outer membrane biosynthesis protein TonB
MGDFVTLIIIGILFGVGTIVRRAMEAAAQKERRRPQGDREFRASRDQIREFLEDIRQGRQATAPAPEPPAEPVEELREFPAEPVEELRQFPAEPAEELQPVAPPRPVEVPPAPVPQAKPRRARKRKGAAAEVRAPVPAQPSAPPAEPAAPPAFRVPDIDLKKAMVWSEIIGRPVSMRRRIGHKPPTLEG